MMPDITISPLNEYYDNFYSKPYQSIYSPEPLYGQTSALSNGWLRTRMVLDKSETRILTQTTQSSIPFVDYELLAESLSSNTKIHKTNN